MCQDNDSANVSFGFTGDLLDPEIITSELGIQPTDAWKKGDMRKGKRAPAYSGLWRIECDCGEVEKSIKALLKIISGKKESIVSLSERYNLNYSIGIWWAPDGGVGGYTIDAEVVREIASYGEVINFYFG